MKAAAFSLGRACRSLWRRRQLIRQLAWHDITTRYRGTILGLAWSMLVPLLMLVIYTFMFSTIFPSRWAGLPPSKAHFAMSLFVGLCLHGFFSDVINRAPSLVIAHPGFVKRVVFPLEVLPVASVCVGLFQLAANLLVLTGVLCFLNGGLPLSSVLLPLVVAPLALVVLGCAWFVASLGVYLRDIAAVVAPLTAASMFLAPVFYAQEAVPPEFRQWLSLNPLTFVIEQSRTVLLYGQLPDWSGLALYAVVAAGWAWAGHAWFQSTKRGFADVL